MSYHQSSTFAVLEALGERLKSARHVLTTFGVMLTPQPGRFAIGQRVLAPGLDECTPRRPAEVLAVGARDDHPGVWCWVRERGLPGGESLVEEDALLSLEGPAPARMSLQRGQGLAMGGMALDRQLAALRAQPALRA